MFGFNSALNNKFPLILTCVQEVLNMTNEIYCP